MEREDYQMEKDTIFGIHPVLEAIKSGVNIDKVFVQKGLKGDNVKELWSAIRSRNITYKLSEPQKLDRLTRKNHQGVFAFISPVPFQRLSQVLLQAFEAGKSPLVMVLEGITDVRNFGAIVRSAECAGADAVVIFEHGSSAINGEAVKASAGALFNIPICKEKSIENAIGFLKESGLKVISTSDKAEHTLYQANFTEPTAILLGNEGEGASHYALSNSDQTVSIPLKGKTSSLNVSVASGILLFEALRQRMG